MRQCEYWVQATGCLTTKPQSLSVQEQMQCGLLCPKQVKMSSVDIRKHMPDVDPAVPP